MITKRKREEDDCRSLNSLPTKRTRITGPNRFNDISNELILRVLSYLSVSELTRAELVCHRFRKLATDNEIWKEKFYNRFVRPRARRIPGLTNADDSKQDKRALFYSSKSARWLEHSSRSTSAVDWKRRYKVKLNWTKGRCKAHEVALDGPEIPRLLVKVFQGKIFTASGRGLRSYSQRTRPQLLHTHHWNATTTKRVPTGLSISSRSNATISVVVGFSDGVLEIFSCTEDGRFQIEHQQELDQSAVVSLACSWPYILTMSHDRNINLLQVTKDTMTNKFIFSTLATLHSDADLSPVSLSIRKASATLIASIAYSFNRLNSGWCLGLQEIRLSFAGEILATRLTSSIDTPEVEFPLRTFATSESYQAPKLLTTRSTSTAPIPLHPTLRTVPNTISHSGCYILAGLPDNTLMVYTIISTESKLEISAGRRLWGHTSSVSGTEVSDRGKALSVSAKGEEIRVWELEDILTGDGGSFSGGKTSTQLKPVKNRGVIGGPDAILESALTRRGNGLGLSLREVKREHEVVWSTRRHWVGFDDEQVVVLGERDQRQILSCYDFA